MKRLICIITTLLIIHAASAQQDWQAIYTEGRRLFEAGDYKKASDKLRQAMAIAERMGTSNPRYKASVDLLAKCYDAVGAHKQSIVLYKTLKDLNTKENKTRTEEHADLLTGLGVSYFKVYEKVKVKKGGVTKEEKKEMLDGAVTNFGLALKLHEFKSGNTSLKYMQTLHWLAKASLNSKKDRIKVPGYYEKLHKARAIFGVTSDEYLEVVKEYADVKRMTKDHPYAVKLYDEHTLLSIQAGKTPKAYLESMYRATKLNVGMHHKAASEASYTSYLQALIKSEGENSKRYNSALDDAINDMITISHKSYLDKLYAQKLAAIEKHEGKQSEAYGRTMYERSENDLSAKRLDAALEYAAASVEAFQAAQTDKHPNYAMAKDLVARIKESAGKIEESESILLASQELRKANLGDQHPAYTIGLDSLGTFYLRRNDIAKAETYFMQSMKIREVKPGKASAQYGSSLGHKATIQRIKKQYEEEGKTLEEQRKIFAKQYGVITPEYSMVAYNIAVNQLRQKKYDEAMAQFQEVRKLFQKTKSGSFWVDKAKAGFLEAKEAKSN